MGVLGQTGLLLFKNLLLRFRYPGIFILEVIWPILIIGIVAVMRTGVPPYKKHDCHYHPRAMPSAGAIPFFQTYVCNLDNRCYKSETDMQSAQDVSNSFSKLSQDLGPYFGSDEVLDVLAVSNRSVNVINVMKNVVGNKELLHGLDEMMNVSRYFRDPDKVKDILVKDYQLFPMTIADALMESRLNVGQILNLTGAPEFREVACNPDNLRQWLNFADGYNATAVSESLCTLNESDVSKLVDEVLRELNVSALFNALKLMEDVKETISGEASLNTVFAEIAKMVELVMTSESIIKVIGNFAALPDIVDLINKIPDWINGFSSFSDTMNQLQNIVSKLKPLMVSLGVDNSSAWMAVNNGIELSANFIKLGEGQWNGTTEEFIQPLIDLIKNIEQLSNEEEGKQAILVLEFLTKIDWVDVYNQFIYTRTLNERTVVHILDSLQIMLEQLPGYDIVQKMARVVEHSLDMMSILVEKSTELRSTLHHLFNGNNMIRRELNRIFQYGPNVTVAMLEAFRDTKVLADLMRNATTYENVCDRILLELHHRVPDDVYQDIQKTMCTGGEVMDALTAVMETLKLTEVWDLVNATIIEIEHLYEGEFFGRTVQLSSLYYHYNHFTTAISDYQYSNYTWEGIFRNVTKDYIDLNDAAWEPVTDMLNEDFITTSVLGLYRGMGDVLVGSRVSTELAPYIHMMSQMTKMLYEMMDSFMNTYNSDAPMMRAVSLFSNYMPEIIRGLDYMWEENMDALYALASSSDPLATFCSRRYIYQMGMPSYVPLDEMNSLICTTNWTATITEMTQPVMDMTKMFEEMIEIFSMDTTNTTYDIELDWIDMVDYSERIMDMLNSGDMTNMDFTMGYMALFDNMNFTKVGEGVDILFQLLGEMTTEDTEKLMELSIRVLENLDNTSSSDPSWQEVKVAIAVVDASLDMMLNLTESSNANSIEGIVRQLPKEAMQMTKLLAKAYPQFVMAMRNILLDPMKLVDFIQQEGFPMPDCENHFVADYTLLAQDNDVLAFEKFMCNLNMTKFLEDMGNQPAITEYNERIEALMENPNAPITIDWAQLVTKVNKITDEFNAMGSSDTFDLYPFNITAINMSWEEFYRAAETIGTLNMTEISELSFKIQDIVFKLVSDGLDDELGTSLYLNSYITYHFMKMANAEMAYFNASSEVNLFDYLWSSELTKITDVLVESPDINAVGVATLQRLLTNPGKAMVETDFDRLCSDVSVFSKVFVVEVSSLSPATLQKLVCDLNINFTLLLDQVQNNRPSIKEFIDAMKVLETDFTVDDLRVDPVKAVDEYVLYSNLLTSIIEHPPTVKLSANEDWMDMNSYSQQWEQLGNKLSTLGQDLQNSSKLMNWQSSMVELMLSAVESIPGTENVLAYMDAILTEMQKQLDNSIDVDSLRKYPNTNRVMELLHFAPEAVQTVIYTSLTQQDKLANWATAFESWTVFCSTPVSTLMSVPPQLSFDIAAYINTACNIDIEEMMRELTQYTSMDRLEDLIANGTKVDVNSSQVVAKFDHLFKSYYDFITETPSMDGAYLARLFNMSVWEVIGDRVTVWANTTNFDFSTPEKVTEFVFGTVGSSLTSLAQSWPEINKGLAIAEIIFDQLEVLLESNTLDTALKDLPSIQVVADLVNELPELFEAVLYTSMFHQEKINEAAMKITSFESFCDVADAMLLLPPNSTFDYSSWLAQLCSINTTRVVEELGNYTVAKKIEHIVNSPSTDSVSFKSVYDKAQEIINKISEGDLPNDRVFDPMVWEDVMGNVEKWSSSWTDGSATDTVETLASVMMKALLSTMQEIPGAEQSLAYIDAILDLMQRQIQETNGNFNGLYNYTNANIILNLLQSAPEAIQTLLYTVMTQPVKTARWGEALQSWVTFCNTPTDDIMTVPPSLKFSMSDYIRSACQLDIEELMTELAQYQGTDRLEQLMSNGTTVSVNSTKVLEKFEKVLKSMVDTVENPADMSDVAFARLFNESLWEEIGHRIQVWSDKSMETYDSPEKIAEVINEILHIMFGGMAAEVTDIIDKAVVVTDIVLGQVLMAVNSNSLNESFHGLPSLQIFVGLLNELPELYETVLYTSLYFSEKISSKVSQITSLEDFCMNNPQDMLVVAPNSTFDLNAWLTTFCSVNITGLVEELQNYNLVVAVDQVINAPSTGPVNFTSVIDKAEKIIEKLEEGLNMKDRVFDPQIWDTVQSQINKWLLSSAEFNEPDWMIGSQIMKALLNVMESIPGTEQSLAYIDVILDLMQRQIQETNGNFNGLYNYTNANIILRLLEFAPEAIQTALYTVMTQPVKTAKWGEALQSWDKFCNTPTDDIMTVPPSLKFSMSDYIRSACQLDIEELMTELAQYQGTDRLEQLLMNGTTVSVNSTKVLEKFDKVLKSMVDTVENPADMSQVKFARIFNESLWIEVGQRIQVWSDKSMETYDSPEKIAEIINEILHIMFGGMAAEVTDIIDKAVVVTDIVLGQVLMAVNSNSLNGSLSGLPSLQILAGLLNDLPELYETVLYTSMYFPEKITAKVSQITSLEDFCMNNPQDMLVVAPNSTFDLNAWLTMFCSVNITGLVEELQNYNLVVAVDQVINAPYAGPVNFTSVIDKAEKIIEKLNEGLDMKDRLFDPQIWDTVQSRVNNWIWPYNDVMKFVQDQQKRLMYAFITYVENTPGSEDMLRYVDAVLDIMGNRIEESQTDLSEAVKDFPTMQTIIHLLDEAPYMIETAIYTVMTQPDKTAAWGEALQSFSAFCGTPVSKIMTVPPGSNFDVAAYIAKLCSVDIDKLVEEITNYQGFDRLQQIALGNDTSSINVTAIMEKSDKVFSSLSNAVNNPVDAATMDLAVFNFTLWENIGHRIETWSSDAMAPTTFNMQTITNMIDQIFGGIVNQSPELKDIYDKVLAMASVLVDEILMSVEASSLEETMDRVPSLKPVFSLVNQAPELFETLVYTSVFYPSKVSQRTEKLVSFDAFCGADATQIFTVPPDSTFDIQAWVDGLCSLNFTEIEEELGQYRTAVEIESIINGSPTIQPNLTSVIEKIDELIQRIEQGVSMNDRVLNVSIWTQVMDRVALWMEDITVMDNLLMSFDGILSMMNQLTSDPAMRADLEPVLYVGVILDNLADIMLSLENRTQFGAADIVEGWTALKNLLNLIQMPGVLDVFMASSRSEHFLALFSNETVRKDFCLTSTNPAKYLIKPDTVNVDLYQIRTAFCDIDFENFMDGFDNFFDTEQLQRVVNGTEVFDWDKLQDKITQVVRIAERWAENPPEFDLPPHFINETYWLSLFDSNQLEQLTTKEQIESIIQQLGPLLEMEGFKQTGIVLNSMLTILNENILSMRDAQYTLGNVVEKIPALKNLFDALGLDSDTMTSLLLAPINNATQFAEVFLADDFQADFCTTDKWRQIMDFPADFDTSGLFMSICQSNVEPLLESLKQSYNLESMLDALNDNSSHVQDWKQSVDKIFQLIDNINDLMDHPPTASSDETLETITKSYSNTTELWKMLSAFSALQQSFGNDSTFSGPFEGVFRVADVLVEFLEDIMARVKLQNGRLDLASIFKDVPEFVRIVNGVLGVEPDPLTGLFSVQLNPAMVEEFIAIANNSTQLSDLMCTESRFKEIFQVQPDVNITSLQSALCGLDFEMMSEKLMESFKINSFADDVTNAWNSNNNVDVEELTKRMEILIAHITNLTTADYVMFGGHDLGDVFMVNATRLMEDLTRQFTGIQDAFTEDYVSLSASIMNSILAQMGNVTEIKTLTLALRFMEVYLKSFNSFLQSIKDQPISLTLLLNNTEVGRIISPLLSDPHMLDGVVNSKIHLKELASIVESPDPVDGLCGEQLWTAIEVPANESQPLKELQGRACSANQSLVLWQTVMLHANGYEIYKQMQALETEIMQGKSSANVTAVSEEMMEFISLMETLIGQYMNGSRSLNDLVDVEGFSAVLDKAQRKIAEQLMESAQEWSVDLSELVLPKVMDNATMLLLGKSLNTANLFMDIFIQKLEGIRAGTISMSSLFTNADGLVTLIETYISVGRNIAQSWIDGEFDEQKLMNLFTDMDRLQMLCGQTNGLTQELTNQTPPSKTVQDLSTVICSSIDNSIVTEVQNFIDYDAIGQQLDNIWRSTQMKPDYAAFSSNVQEFTTLVEDLSSTSLTVNSSLSDILDFTSTFGALEDIAADPKVIFRLMKFLGLVIEGPLHEEQDIVKVMSGVNTFAILPVINVLDALKANGLTLMTLVNNPDLLLNILPTVVDFDVHYAIIRDTVVRSQLNQVLHYRDSLCNSSNYESVLIGNGIEHITLPVSWLDVWAAVCQASDVDTAISKMEELGLTNVQIIAVTDKMFAGYNIDQLPDMYDRDFGWVDMMSSLERLTDLITQGEMSTERLDTMQNAWETVKDIVFDKSMRSLFSYLSLLEDSAGPDEGWARFKQFLKFFSSALNFMDKNMKKIGSDTVIRLEDILPDSDRVAALVEDVFGRQNAAELLTTIIDPIMFYRITLEDTWDEVCRENNSISNYFHFPAGTDVDAVHTSLCRAVTTRSSSFEELLSLLDAGDMFKELNKLIQDDSDKYWINNTIFETTHSAIMHLIDTAETLQDARLDESSVEAWLQPIMNVLTSLQNAQSSQVVGFCESMIHYLNNTDGYSDAKPVLWVVSTSINLIADLSKLIPQLDEIACTFVNDARIDLYGGIDKLSQIGLWDDITKAVDEYMKPPAAYNCSASLYASTLLMENINATFSSNGLDVDKLTHCLANTEKHIEAILTSFTETLNFVKDMADILQMPELHDFLQDPNIKPVADFIIGAINEHGQKLISFGDLLEDRVSASNYLVNTLGISQSVVDAFMNATVSDDWTYFLTMSVMEVTDIMCDPARLDKILSLPPGSGVNITEISQLICTSEVTTTVSYLKNMAASTSDITDMISDGENLMDVVITVTRKLADIIVQFEDLIDFTTAMMTDFDIDDLKQNVDLIDDILQGQGLSDLANSLRVLLDNIAKLIPQNSDTEMVIRDIKRILDGILGLDILKDEVMKAVRVKDLVKDPKYMSFYLTTQLGFSPEVAQSVLDAFFSSRIFLDIEEQPSYTCNEVFKMILVMNDTQATAGTIRNAFCGLNDDQLKGLMDLLTPELNIGTLVAKYVTYSGEEILKSTNMTTTELDDMVEKIDKGLVNLKEASDIIKKSPNGTQIMDLFSGGTANAFVSMEELTPVICGGDVVDIFAMDFNPGVIISSSNEIADLVAIEDDLSLVESDLPNEFCIEIYETVKNSGIGGILWSYLKPILRGKILYTPDNDVTRAVLRKANKLFDLLDEVRNISEIWATQTPNLMAMADAANDTDDLRDALENDFIQGLLEATVGVKSKSLMSGLDALQANNFDRSQLVALQKAAQVVYNYTSCILTDRFQPVASEEELEHEAYLLNKNKTFFAGIVFLNAGEDDSVAGNRKKRQAEPTIPKHIGYKIRMDIDNVMDTSRLKSPIWKMSAEDNFVEDMRYLRGFMYLQDMVDTAIIELHKNQMLSTPGFHIRQMPFPCHHLDNFIFLLGSYLIPVMMTFTFLASLGVATHNLVYDRENGQEENLHVMGMMRGLNFSAWLFSTMLLMGIVCLVIAIMLKYTDIFIYSNLLIVFLLLVCFCFSSVMLLYMVSAFFNRTTMAILFVLMIYLISYLPYILVVSLEVDMKFWQKSLACLASTTAFSFGTLKLSHYEESGTGVHWSNIDETTEDNDASVSWCCIMMLIDSAIYFLVGWYVRHVRPGKYGISQPWYFPILPSFWCSCFGCVTSSSDAFSDAQQPTGKMFEPPPEDHSVGIALENLSKKYSGKKYAVKDLSVRFYRGQITSLLGHNGAAKTTTLNMICGVLEPTSGHVLIDGKKSSCCRQSLGVCPQQNALFYYMSVQEHMKFYAGVKVNEENHSTPEKLAEIRKLLKDVDLWHARDTPVNDLSYGMKRRLCVALAFVGGSKTIVLDEPTSGVDPHARKNIWNLITRNRPGRTILLSTHHLDEADILSDRIAVMHQGKLLCCGSPAFLKRALGGGFQLTMVKKDIAVVPENAGSEAAEGSTSSTETIEKYIQSLCPEATLIEQVGSDLTFSLPKEESRMKIPFYNFFKQLDQFSNQLGIASYGLSDTTLEEVFLQLTQEADDASDPGVVNPVLTSRDRLTTLHLGNVEGAQRGTMDKTLFSPAARMQYTPRKDNHMMGTLFDGFCTGLSDPSLERNFFIPATRIHYVSNSEFGRRKSLHHWPYKNGSTDSVLSAVPSAPGDDKKRRKGLTLTFCQIGAMLVKRFHHYRRNWRILISAVVLPLIFFLIAMAFSTVRVDEGDMKKLVLDPSLYGAGTQTFIQNEAKNTMAYSFADTMTKSTRVGIGTVCMDDWAQEYFDKQQCVNETSWYTESKPFYLVRCSDARQVFSRMPQNYTLQEKLVTSNQYIEDLDNLNIPSYLLRTFRDHKEDRYGGWSFESDPDGNTRDVNPYAWFNSKGYHAMPSFFNSLSNTVLRSQLPPGARPEEYGITTITHPIRLGRAALTMKTIQGDAADAGIALMMVVAFSFIPGGFILYLINEKVQKERQLQNISGVNFLTYWLVALIWDMFIYAIVVGLAIAIVAIFKTDSYYMRDNLAAVTVMLLLYGWAIIPCLYCCVRFFNKGSTAYLVTFCVNLFLALSTIISLLVMQLFRDSDNVWEAYKVCKYLYLIFPQYSLGQGLMDLVANTVKFKLFERFGEDRYDDPFTTDVCGWFMLALGAEGLLFFILNLILDGIKMPAISLPGKKSRYEATIEDDDVVREKERIKAGGNHDILLVDDLSKIYRRGWKKFHAVNHISFGVPQGECFGLLGVNGAGKTTTFRMLTGDSKASGGAASLNGHRLRPNGQDVGYCPQEGGLDEYLTGTETLYFHSRLYGFSDDQTKHIVSELLDRVALRPYAHKAVHTYSGGTKKKLALAVALLGDPPILYLDEPTTGMDAGTRRLAWQCIAEANRNGQSVVLTSHSMDECDSLCSRIAIMVNGQIKCIGSPQHLKHKFGDGYTLVMHAASSHLNDIAHSFLHKFPGTVIKEKHHSSVEMRIPQATASVADILASLQKAEEDNAIDYYSLSQTTLDSVFISFAKEQTDNFEDVASSSQESTSGSKSDYQSETDSASSDYTKKESPRYVFSNPEFVPDEVTFAPGTTPTSTGNYAQNVVLGSGQKVVDPEEVYVTKL